MRSVKRLTILVVVLFAVAFGLFLSELPRPGVGQSEPVRQGDGIVVPTGGQARVATGLDMLADGASRLLITGVFEETSLTSLLRQAGRLRPDCCVDLDRDARDTFGNAKVARSWADKHNVKRLHLVTSWYHIPRTRYLFERLMPKRTIFVHPVFPADAGAEPWWRRGDGWRLVLTEFGKYVWALFRLELGGWS